MLEKYYKLFILPAISFRWHSHCFIIVIQITTSIINQSEFVFYAFIGDWMLKKWDSVVLLATLQLNYISKKTIAIFLLCILLVRASHFPWQRRDVCETWKEIRLESLCQTRLCFNHHFLFSLTRPDICIEWQWKTRNNTKGLIFFLWQPALHIYKTDIKLYSLL